MKETLDYELETMLLKIDDFRNYNLEYFDETQLAQFDSFKNVINFLVKANKDLLKHITKKRYDIDTDNRDLYECKVPETCNTCKYKYNEGTKLFCSYKKANLEVKGHDRCKYYD